MGETDGSAGVRKPHHVRQYSGTHPTLDSRLVLATGDHDGDGDDEIFLDGEQDVLVFANAGARTFSDAGRYGLGRDGRAITYADATGDDVGDIIALATTEQPSALYGGLVVLPGLRFDPAEAEEPGPIRAEAGFRLSQISPNPFGTSAQLHLDVTQEQDVTVELIDPAGRRVSSVFTGRLDAGASRRMTIDGAGLAGGVYWVAIRGETFETVRKAVLLK